MNTITVCPACLMQLPDGYPYDHVAIDRVLSGDRILFAAMSRAEKQQVVITGLARRRSLRDLTDQLTWPYAALQTLLPDEHPQSKAAESTRVEAQITELWHRRLSDVEICIRTGLNPGKIGRIRKRLGLPTVPTTEALRRWRHEASTY
jgi:hypothetical protein